ncbi:MAG TPA: 1-(5-phosphoribosyl)-5-[(5-phosphoribosylamino)methylideneamino]imidazole-4-carboxamide isomerase [Ignavibacteria bacterium]|nr:1-(5-phosphoribosyl)-5-[(5-phosphoribosylamino)methylideneamino]imidazole-4-carboxamide isomerase [Ignavibacteria bacterium]
MLVIPVIDIKDGKVVRILEGLKNQTEYYCESPVNVAKLFRKENFKTLHITDLDGAINGEMKNFPLIAGIIKSLDIPIQVGGGVRNFDTVRIMIEELGVYRVVIGTAAITNPDLVKQIIKEYSASKVVIGIDEKLNNVVQNGWVNYANITPLDFAKMMEDIGIKRIIYQDVTRVGNLTGPHIERLIELATQTNLRITSAGGIHDYKDLEELSKIENLGIDSVMIGRALYENMFPCQKLWREMECEDISLELPKVKGI